MLQAKQPLVAIFPGFPNLGDERVRQALAVIAQIPDSERYHRPTGIDVALILMDFKVDVETILAAILSDPRLEGLKLKPDIVKLFGVTTAALVTDINWLNSLNVYSTEMSRQPKQAETLRRMLLSMTRDVRAVLVKLAYRVQRLRVLVNEPETMHRYIAQETLDIYAPIANRLGIHQFKWELEDLAFRYLEPQIYLNIAKALDAKREEREACIGRFSQMLKNWLAKEGIRAEMSGRPKHIYSIWKKMQRKQLDMDKLYDLLAIRVIVDDLSTCYAVLGLVQCGWQYMAEEFDDYIANPKENGYQSLHTVVLDDQGNRIEVQIRTQAMHEYAELGIAAHWSYKEGGKHNPAMEKSIASLRNLLSEKDNIKKLSEDFHSELFQDRVYVLTPNGKLIDLVKGATPLDFAYAIHTEIGHSCRGAKVNGRIMPLTYTLNSGERVEILTGKDIKPNGNWIDPNLGYLKSAHAIGKVKSWLRHQHRDENRAEGRAILDKEAHRLGLKAINLKKLAQHYKFAETDAFLEAVGRGDINNRQLAAYFKAPELGIKHYSAAKKKSGAKLAVTVEDMANVLARFAHCCSPAPGDTIVGYITYRRGLTVHRTDCGNIKRLDQSQRSQLITVHWLPQTR